MPFKDVEELQGFIFRGKYSRLEPFAGSFKELASQFPPQLRDLQFGAEQNIPDAGTYFLCISNQTDLALGYFKCISHLNSFEMEIHCGFFNTNSFILRTAIESLFVACFCIKEFWKYKRITSLVDSNHFIGIQFLVSCGFAITDRIKIGENDYFSLEMMLCLDELPIFHRFKAKWDLQLPQIDRFNDEIHHFLPTNKIIPSISERKEIYKTTIEILPSVTGLKAWLNFVNVLNLSPEVRRFVQIKRKISYLYREQVKIYLANNQIRIFLGRNNNKDLGYAFVKRMDDYSEIYFHPTLVTISDSIFIHFIEALLAKHYLNRELLSKVNTNDWNRITFLRRLGFEIRGFASLKNGRANEIVLFRTITRKVKMARPTRR
jgi:hypothetical protein